MPTDSRGKGRIFDEIKSRGKEERKAAELEGFAAENIKEGLYSKNHFSWTYGSRGKCNLKSSHQDIKTGY